MSALQDQQGAAFDMLDKQLAARLRQLASQQVVKPVEFSSFVREYQNLETYATMYNNNNYVNKQWRSEKVIYDAWIPKIQAKVHETPGTQTLVPQRPTYTPTLYTLSAFSAMQGGNFSCGSCGGGSSQPPSTKVEPRSPTQLALDSNYPAGFIPNVGDLLKRLLEAPPPQTISPITPPPPILSSREIASGVITALVVGIIVYVVRRWRKIAL